MDHDLPTSPPISITITGKTVVITGGSRGIGLGLVKEFLSRGNVVVATARDPATVGALAELQQQQAGPGPSTDSRLIALPLEVSDGSSRRAFAEALKREGITHVDVLVNNAGILPQAAPFDQLKEDDLLKGFHVNAVGPLMLTQQLLAEGLLGKPGGQSTVVNISSVMSIIADEAWWQLLAQWKGAYAYRASKVALNMLSREMADELAPRGVTVVLLHPGYTKTDMNGYAEGAIEVGESVAGIMRVLEAGGATAPPRVAGSRAGLGGRFLSYDGSELPW